MRTGLNGKWVLYQNQNVFNGLTVIINPDPVSMLIYNLTLTLTLTVKPLLDQAWDTTRLDQAGTDE